MAAERLLAGIMLVSGYPDKTNDAGKPSVASNRFPESGLFQNMHKKEHCHQHSAPAFSTLKLGESKQ